MYERMKIPFYAMLEGGERFGKGTQANLLEKYLEEKKILYKKIREPGETFIGKEIRRLLLDLKGIHLHPIAELFLYSADRVETFDKIIKPSLEEGVSILEDRSWPSTKVYQGGLRKLDYTHKGLVDYLNKIATFGILPDILFILTGNQKERMKVIKNRDKLEESVMKNPDAIDEGYLKIIKEYPNISVPIHFQEGNPQAMQEEIRHHLKKRLEI